MGYIGRYVDEERIDGWSDFEWMKSVGLGVTVGGKVFGRIPSPNGGIRMVSAW